MRSRNLAALESLLRTTTNAAEPEFKIALGGLRSEIKDRLRTGSPSSIQFLVSSVQALSRLRGFANAEVRLNCLFDISFFLATQGYSPDAAPAVNEMVALAEGIGDARWARLAYMVRGIASMDVGDIAQAIIWYSKAWQLALATGDHGGQGAVLTNLAGAFIYGGMYREAIPCLQQGLRLLRLPHVQQALVSTGYPATESECAALNNLAQAYLYVEDYEAGYATISDCLAKCEEPFDGRTAVSRIVREFTFVQLALELGKIQEAKEHAAISERHAQSHGRRAHQLARICRGLCDVHAGDPDTGIKRIESALELVELERTVRAPTLVPLIRACESAERPDTALKYMKLLVDDVRQTREAGIRTLLAQDHGAELAAKAKSADDLRFLESTEARLRSKVAERNALDARIEMLERLAVTADLKEEQSGEHGYRVGRLSFLMAEVLSWNKAECSAIDIAARLHDIGKIGVPDRILFNTQQLRDAERDMMSVHTLIGAEILARSDITYLRMAEEIARYHHEWWDGSGYPTKLVGKRIPIHARIVALADVFDALTHGRPYAPAWPIQKALEEIQLRRGTQFDPELTDKFIELVHRLQNEHDDLDEFLGRAGRNSPFAQARSRIRLMLEEGRERIEESIAAASETIH